MNLQDLQKDWGNQYDKQGTENNLVVKLFKESRQSKINANLRKITAYSILFTLFNIFVNSYTWYILVRNFDNLSLRYAGIVMLVLSYIVIFMNALQFESITKINNSKPIVKLQKRIGKLKIQRIKHNRFIFILSNLYFWLMVVLVFQLDLLILIPEIWKNAASVIVVNVGFMVIWFPLAFWFLNKYDSKEQLSKFWQKMKNESFLTDKSVNFSLNKALSYMHEIEVFEKDEIGK
ncbi:MAG: hypothetical protein B6I20_09875 [Bacteroidetes bacterium 4572_117]|nr:MAG: hypothetical protein B6I20_09875 [Bacteroidetes bacterium 4572_117]